MSLAEKMVVGLLGTALVVGLSSRMLPQAKFLCTIVCSGLILIAMIISFLVYMSSS